MLGAFTCDIVKTESAKRSSLADVSQNVSRKQNIHPKKKMFLKHLLTWSTKRSTSTLLSKQMLYSNVGTFSWGFTGDFQKKNHSHIT